jgi:hypothetical protein
LAELEDTIAELEEDDELELVGCALDVLELASALEEDVDQLELVLGAVD